MPPQRDVGRSLSSCAAAAAGLATALRRRPWRSGGAARIGGPRDVRAGRQAIIARGWNRSGRLRSASARCVLRRRRSLGPALCSPTVCFPCTASACVQFEALRTQLMAYDKHREIVQTIDFPPQRWFGKLKQSTVDERIAGLGSWLSKIIARRYSVRRFLSNFSAAQDQQQAVAMPPRRGVESKEGLWDEGPGQETLLLMCDGAACRRVSCTCGSWQWAAGVGVGSLCC